MAATQLSVFQMALRFLGDLRLATVADDVESQYALTDAWASAPEFVLRQAPWRFAAKQVTLTAGGSPLTGYTTSYAYPADWLRTHAIFLLNAQSRECPFDLREQGTISTNVSTAPLIRYISSSFADPSFANWPEHFAECVAAYLAFLVAERVTGERSSSGRMSELFSSLLPQATAIDAMAEDPWLPHQRSGTFLRIARTMINEGMWRFAMKTVQLTAPAGAGDGGLANKFTIPSDWGQTRSLYQLASDGRRCPFDVRETGGFWHTNATGFYAQYVSNTLGMDSTQWPDAYMNAALRRIEADTASRHDQENSPPTYGRDYQLRADQAWQQSLVDAIDSEADAPDPWLRYQRDGSFDRAAHAVLARGNWTFPGAMKTVDIDSSTQEVASADTGFPYRYPLPSDWFKTCALYIGIDGQECPINIRQSAEDWSTDRAAFTARYLSTATLTATNWPEIVAQAVMAYLDWQTSDTAKKSDPKEETAQDQGDAAEFVGLLADAVKAHSVEDDDWLRFQLDGRFRQAVALTLEKARWKFAINTVRLQTDNDPSNATIALSGTVTGGDVLSVQISNGAIPNSPVTVSAAAQSNDTLMTLAARLANAINASPEFSVSGIAASTDNVTVEWLSAFLNSGLTFGFPTVVPTEGDPVINIVLSKPLNPTVPQSVIATAQPGGGNVSYTLSVTGAKTETLTLGVYAGQNPSPGYAYRCPKPNDWLRTIRLYYSMMDGSRPLWFDVDYRDEGGAFHTNYFPPVVRYLSRTGYDSTAWSSNFRDAVLAWLQHIEARGDPKMAAIAAARFKFWQDQLQEAEEQDDTREVPQIKTGGRLTRGRYGRGTLDLEQAMPPFNPL